MDNHRRKSTRKPSVPTAAFLSVELPPEFRPMPEKVDVKKSYSWGDLLNRLVGKSTLFDMSDVVVPVDTLAEALYKDIFAAIIDKDGNIIVEVERREPREVITHHVPVPRDLKPRDVQRLKIEEERPDSDIEIIETESPRLKPITAPAQPKILWFAQIIRVAGYRVLLRWLGMEKEPQPDKDDFWLNIASNDLHAGGYAVSRPRGAAYLTPPDHLIKHATREWLGTRIDTMFSLPKDFELIRDKIRISKFQIGERLELLDAMSSTNLRPARVMNVVGRRVRVQVLPDESYLNSDPCGDRQFGTYYWVDECSFLLFPVGWALRNGYTLVGTKRFMEHAHRIAAAMEKNEEPPFEPFDVRPDRFEWREQKTFTDDTRPEIKTEVPFDPYDVPSDRFVGVLEPVLDMDEKPPQGEWKVGMRLECFDPLERQCNRLKVANVMEILKDGYLRIGFDGGEEMFEESLPLHKNSPFLCPRGYARKYGIELQAPDNYEEEVFKWKNYLIKTGVEAAPKDLFHHTDEEGIKKNFAIGAKVEAPDMCEPNLILSASVKSVHGRFIRVLADGWNEEYEQLFEYRSGDLLPLGWCEMHKYKLEAPANAPSDDPDAMFCV